MAIIIDADVIIKGEKGAFDLKAWIAQQIEELEVAAITVAELWHGVERATVPYRTRRERYIRTILDGVVIIPYTQATALEHTRIWAACEASGKAVAPYDLIVAATAVERGSTVATFNRRHFEKIDGIKVIEPR
jgi:predicted nucleic acid-binding protein